MKKKVIVICIILLALFLAASLALYLYFQSPTYILNNVAEEYESIAEDFYNLNHDKLAQLSELTQSITDTDTYYYTFHVSEYNSLNISSNIKTILQGMEAETNDNLVFFITKKVIEIHFVSQTNLIVILENGCPLESHATKPEWNRLMALDVEWRVCSAYILRS